MGLDQPLIVQYFTYIGNVLHGNLGYSYTYNEEVSTLIAQALPMTALLGLAGLTCRWPSRSRSEWSPASSAVPSGHLRDDLRAPRPVGLDRVAGGRARPGVRGQPPLAADIRIRWTRLPHPPRDLCRRPGLRADDANAPIRDDRITQQDYIMAARARGIRRTRIYGTYAFKNAVLPLITVIGSQIGMVMAGSHRDRDHLQLARNRPV